MTVTTPTFAIVGAVNHGKSSVVSTLAENDQVRISSQPGETIECQRFYLSDLFVFYDTPGFQNASEALRELTHAAHARDPLSVFGEFLLRQAGDDKFAAECLLLGPVVDGAGIIYVVDGSEPVLDIHIAEMEVLRLTGQPRLAIINRTNADDHVQDWKRRLGLHFNAVREFNAHQATFGDRLELLETLAGIEQSWKPKLMSAVAIFREEWNQRLSECAEIIVSLLAFGLTHYEVEDSISHVTDAQLVERFVVAVKDREAKAHRAIIKLFGHNRVHAAADEDHVLFAELFCAETWLMFGLDAKQIVAAGAAAGAASGVFFDTVTVGHSIGIPTIVGTLGGAISGYVMGKKQPEISVGRKLFGLRIGRRARSVGPSKAANLPWIFIDRAFGTFAYVINRAHARRDEKTINGARLQKAMEANGFSSARWGVGARKQCEDIFSQIKRHKKLQVEDRQRLRELLLLRLADISAVKMLITLEG